MNYNQALEFLSVCHKFGKKEGMHRISALLKHLGDPQKKLKYVHITGTNGKGSVVAFTSSILKEAGYKVGSFTSPYIYRFNERVQINGEQISDEDVSRIIGIIKQKIDVMLENDEGCPTEFEVVTALGFVYFAEKNCDIVVLEVGIGGKLDSTNIIETSEVSVVTTIDFDHTNILGNTLVEIAHHKAGIVKQNGDLVLYPQVPETLNVFETVCSEKNAKLHKVDIDSLILKNANLKSQTFDYKNYKDLEINLVSDFQIFNASTAIETIDILATKGHTITAEQIKKGLLNTKWPARFDVLNDSPFFIVDGAHNVQGCKHLRFSLEKYFKHQKIIFIFGVLKDKDFKEMIQILAPLAKTFIATEPQNPRALPANELATQLKEIHQSVIVKKLPRDAVLHSLKIADQTDVICAFGSLYYLGEISSFFAKDKTNARLM